MPVAAYPSTVKITGTPTAFTGEATTDIGGTHLTYQITDATKRAVDPDAAITVKKNGVSQSSTLWTFDYLFGKVTFLSALLGGDTVTIDGNYLPLLTVATARGFSISVKREVLETTIFQTTDGRLKVLGLGDASGTLDWLDFGITDLDPGAGTRSVWDVLRLGTRHLIEIFPAATGNKFRAWVRFTSIEDKATFDGLVEGSISWLTVTSENNLASYGWGT